MIFSQEKGIGVSILRIMLGDEGDGGAEIAEPQKGVFVWDDPDWETKKEDFDKGQIWLVNEAKKRGVKTFMSTAWSPPDWMKTNNAYNAVSLGMLKPECYQDYADYLAEYVLGYKKYFGIDISYVSIANEPTIPSGYAGCLWSPNDMNKFIRDYLGPTFEARGVKAGIILPESVNFDEFAALPALNDSKTAGYVDVIGVHAYEKSLYLPEFTVSREKGKRVWQTEFMNQGVELQTYENNTITDGLKYADLIGNMFSTSGISAYFYWWLAANNNADGSDLIRLCTGGEAGSPTENGLFRVFKRYYAFGNYSRFVRPEFKMIRADVSPDENIVITAFKEPFALLIACSG
jgi:glucuronoarabinoxylan endo-1,4-beta-xylanase